MSSERSARALVVGSAVGRVAARAWTRRRGWCWRRCCCGRRLSVVIGWLRVFRCDRWPGSLGLAKDTAATLFAVFRAAGLVGNGRPAADRQRCVRHRRLRDHHDPPGCHLGQDGQGRQAESPSTLVERRPRPAPTLARGLRKPVAMSSSCSSDPVAAAGARRRPVCRRWCDWAVVMLRVTTLYASSAAATAAYYARYLTEAPGEAPGVWSGRQAGGFGLAGEVHAGAWS